MQVADDAVLGDRQVVGFQLPRRAIGLLRLFLVGGEQRRAEHARRGPWRASRIVVWRPRPGTVYSAGDPPRGLEQQLAGVETPPPITTSSGSNVLIALAIPMPEPLAQHVAARAARRVARLAPVDHVVRR